MKLHFHQIKIFDVESHYTLFDIIIKEQLLFVFENTID